MTNSKKGNSPLVNSETNIKATRPPKIVRTVFRKGCGFSRIICDLAIKTLRLSNCHNDTPISVNVEIF